MTEPITYIATYSDDSQDEVWRAIPGHPGYEVSSMGRVRSWKGRGRRRREQPVLLKLIATPSRAPYLDAQIFTGKNYRIPVHTLVALAFIGPRPERADVRHLDGNPLNNTLTNLAYGSRLENMADAIGHGSFIRTRKTHCKQGHEFTPENTYINKLGHQQCRTCRQRWAQDVEARRAPRSHKKKEAAA